jgi:hypothetical protein
VAHPDDAVPATAPPHASEPPRPPTTAASDARTGPREVSLAWNVAVPAAVGSIPIVVLLVVRHPPYTAVDPWGMLLLVTVPVCGLVAGLLGRRTGSAYLVMAGSFWVAQSLALWISVCSDVASGASCGMRSGTGGLAFAALLVALLGVAPLTVAYAIASRTRRRRT